MTDRNHELIAAYEEINRLLKLEVGNEALSYRQLIDKTASKRPIIRTNKNFLLQVEDVRQVLAHPARFGVGRAFEVTEPYLAHVQKIIQNLLQEPRAHDLGVAVGDLFCAGRDDTIRYIVAKMRERKYSHVPILVGDLLEGVFSENTLFEYLCSVEIATLDENTRIGDVFAYCEMTDTRLERYKFTHPGQLYDDVVKIFTEGLGATERIGALFVTDNGNPKDHLQRMITAWDVLAG